MNIFQDTPLNDIHDDLFGRETLVELIVDSINDTVSSDHPCIVYGIYGKWGEGKTSLLNFVKNRLLSQGKQDNIILVEFNPWLLNNEEFLLQEFFKSIIKDNVTAVRNALQKYCSLILMASKTIAKYTVPMVGDSVEKSMDLVQKILNDQKLTISELKKKTSDAIVKSKHHLVVMIEDVDRLDKEEVHALLRLVRQMADFNNCIYIVSMDVDLVSKSVGSYHGVGSEQDGHKFLEKIVQIPITLPKVPRSNMLKIVRRYLSMTLKGYTDSDNIKLIADAIAPFIRNIRDLKRYCNQLTFVLPHLKNEVNLHDLCILEAIKIVSNESYNRIYERRDQLMHIIDHVQRLLNKESADKLVEDNYQKAKSYIVDGLSDEIAGQIDAALDTLFSNSSYDTQIDLDEKRINTDIYFSKYFALTVPSDLIPDSEMDKLLPKVLGHYDSVCKKINEWSENYSSSEVLRASLFLIRKFDNDEKKATAASTIACALSVSKLAKDYPTALNLDPYALSSFIPYQILKPYLVSTGKDQPDTTKLKETLKFIFNKAEINFCMNFLCSAKDVLSSSKKILFAITPLIDRFLNLSFKEQFSYSKLLLVTLFIYWKKINAETHISTFDMFANTLLCDKDIPYLRIMDKFMDGENDEQDVLDFVSIFRNQDSTINKRIEKDLETSKKHHSVKLFLKYYQQELENLE